MKYYKLLLSTLLILGACTTKIDTTNTQIDIMDKHSFSKPLEAKVTHLNWQATVDFENSVIHAIAKLDIKKAKDVTALLLDTKSLNIEKVSDQDGNTLNYNLGSELPHLGQALSIEINNQTTQVAIVYHTSPDAEAVQWLSPQQTANKTSPFLFTQSQAILARSWIPIQDSPGIRFTYNATVTIPNNLIALMSASNPTSKNETGIYQFEMKQPIPAYLLALSVGDVEFQALGKRSGVYAESSLLEKSAYEFEDLEKMIAAAEDLYGPYQWERYDLIVLPPSFPFGGMENPRLTFATPTIIAGDKSLTSLVAHELAHSWSGNLVTNATWNDFWLNEGFTVYFEYRIMESLYGRAYSEMLALLSMQDLRSEVEEMIANNQQLDTHLFLNLDGRSPDDGMTSIAYDKGYFFLRMLEEKIGRDKWDTFLKEYFTSNAFKVMTTNEFTSILENKLKIDSTVYSPWIFGPGLPDNCPTPISDKFANVERALTHWLVNQDKKALATSYATSEWSSHEWLQFVRSIPSNIGTEHLKKLDLAFDFTNTGNSEIFTAWAVQAISNNYSPAKETINQFLINTGRRKFLMPIYNEMLNSPEGQTWAKEVYPLARPNYHFVVTSSLDPLILN
ncbi:MAG: M1 family metallopeptidase [Reichenbachiella sp.]